MTVGMGLIGLGSIYRAHAEGYRRHAAAEVVAVCDADEARSSAEAKEWGAKAFSDYHRLLEVSDVDAVDIMLPHSLHEPVALAALEAGKHVLVEKPIAPSLAAADRLFEAAERSGKVLALAENTRFVAAYRAIEPLVRGGELGDVQLVRTMICGNETERLSRPELWKGRRDGTVGGAILDAGAHSFYLLRWMFGGFEHVSGRGERRVPVSEVEDFGVVTGRLVTGADFLTEFSFTAEIPWNERLEVYGSAGSLIVDQLADPVVKHFRHGKDYEGTPLPVPYAPRTWKQESIAEGVVDFVSALEEERQPLVDLLQVRDAMQALGLAYRSLEEGGARLFVGSSPG
jgi:predicted dehydrogenase